MPNNNISFGDFNFTAVLAETNTTQVYSTSPVAITIRVLFVNNPPYFTLAVSSMSYFENQSPLTKSVQFGTGMNTGAPTESGQIMSYVMTTTCSAGLFSSAPAITTDQSSSTLSFTLATYQWLSTPCSFSIQLFDNGGVANGGSNSSTVQIITLAVHWVNQPPSFTAGSLSIVNTENLTSSAAYSYSWASNLSPGINDLPDSGMFFTVTQIDTTNPSLFTVAPAISQSGVLTYTVAQNQSGYADFTVFLTDSQGTAHGGAQTPRPR